jgi:hypothetical protein
MSEVTGESFSNMVFGSKYSSHWEVVEGYFVEHLASLQSEIEMCRKQKDQLTKARDELVQDVLRLNQKTVDLNTKNEHLTRTIAEKENKISAFMYEPSAEEEKLKKSNHRRSVGVTLTDTPCSPEVATNNNDIIQSYVPDDRHSKPTAISTSHNNNTQDVTKIASPSKKENTTGIFRQLSRKISRKKKNHDENTFQNSNGSKNNNYHTQSGSSSSGSRSGSLSSNSYDMQTEDLLHPAVVISSTDDRREDRTIKEARHKQKNRMCS